MAVNGHHHIRTDDAQGQPSKHAAVCGNIRRIGWHLAAYSKVHPDFWGLRKLAQHSATVMQIADAVWMSMLLSAFAGILAVTVVVATFYFIRWASILNVQTFHLSNAPFACTYAVSNILLEKKACNGWAQPAY